MDLKNKKSPFVLSDAIINNWTATTSDNLYTPFPVGKVEGFTIDSLVIAGSANNCLKATFSLPQDNGTKSMSNTFYFNPRKDFNVTEEAYFNSLSKVALEVLKLIKCVYNEAPMPKFAIDGWDDFIRKATVWFLQGDAQGEPCAGIFEYDNNNYVRLRKWSEMENIIRMGTNAELILTGKERLKKNEKE